MSWIWLMVFVVQAAVFQGSVEYRADVVVSGLRSPWGGVALPNGDLLITEKRGSVAVVRDGALLHRLRGVPVGRIAVEGQGGLLGVAAHPRFLETRWVYLAYSTREMARPRGGINTRVSRFVLRGRTLSDEKILVQGAFGDDGAHFGCRMVFDSQGFLYASFGERHNKELAQDLRFLNGKVIRIRDDGSIPEDNPFVEDAQRDARVRAEIFTFGHRNPQGIDVHPVSGQVFVSEHGPSGYDAQLPGVGRVGKADEVNGLLAGRNYGWPVLFGDPEILPWTQQMFRFQRDNNTVSPLKEFTIPDAIAPSGARFYDGDVFPRWKNSFFVAALRGYIVRLQISAQGQLVEEEVIIPRGFSRVRHVFPGREGYLYVIAGAGDLIRISPAGDQVSEDSRPDSDGDDEPNGPPVEDALQSQVRNLFEGRRCFQCHSEQLQDFSKWPAAWVGTSLQSSRMIRALRSGRMPIGADPLNSEELDLVQTYLRRFW